TGLRRAVVNEFIARGRRHRARLGRFFASGRLPGFAAVIGALDDLPEPAAGLRGIQPVRVNRRSLDVVQLPAREMRTADIPAFALAVRLQDECALACANQYSYVAHPHSSLPAPRVVTLYR